MNTQNPSPEFGSLEPIPLETALHKLVDRDDLYVFGHGTSQKDNAATTLSDGLHLSQANLWSTVLGFESSHENPDAFEATKQLLEEWPHHRTKFVVALGIERLQPGQIPDRRYLQSVVQYRDGHEDMDPQYGHRFVIDPRFVAGYFDVEAKLFLPNPNFDPKYDPALLDTAADTDILRERDRAPVLRGMGGTAIESGRSSVQPSALDDGDLPDVW